MNISKKKNYAHIYTDDRRDATNIYHNYLCVHPFRFIFIVCLDGNYFR